MLPLGAIRSRPWPLISAAHGVVACLVAMAAVTAYGLWHSAVLTQPNWSPLLARQASMIMTIASVVTPVCLYALPAWSRGWRALSAVIGFFCLALAGFGAGLAALLIGLCCLTAGQSIFLLAGLRTQVPAILSATTGLGAILLVLVGAGLTHLALILVIWTILAASLLGLVFSRPLRKAIWASLQPGEPVQAWTAPRALVAWLILGALLFYAANATLPERFWDALVMHLMIPTQILQSGHWNHDPARMAWALFPLGADMMFTFAMALGGENAAKLLNVLALAGILRLVSDMVRDTGTPLLAEITVLLLLALPIALLSSSSAMVENLLALQILAAVYALRLLRGEAAFAALLALAVLLPSMLATKLHGAAAALPITLAASALIPAGKLRRREWLALAIVALIAGSLGASPYLDALLRTGNPVFPLINDLFKSPLWPPSPFQDLRWQGHLSWDLLYRMTFDSAAYLEAYPGAMGFGCLLLLLPGIAATILRPKTTPLLALLVGGTYGAVVLHEIQYIRYLYPVMPLALIVAAHGLQTIAKLPGGVALGHGAAMVASVLGLLVLPSGAWTLRAADLRAGWDPAARHRMLVTQVPTRLAVDIVNAIANTTGKTQPRVLFGGEPYGAFLQGHYIYAAWYNRRLNAALIAAPDVGTADSVLEAERPDFVIAVPGSADPVEQRVVRYAERHGTRLPVPGGTGLWQIERQGMTGSGVFRLTR